MAYPYRQEVLQDAKPKKKEGKKKKEEDGQRPERIRNSDGSDDLAVTRLPHRPLGGAGVGPSEPAKEKRNIPGGQ